MPEGWQALYADSNPVALFSEAVELNDESLRYFQIIDDQGQYISRSNNKHAFSNNLNLWDELHRYNFPNGTSIQSIRENVKNHQSGSFWFSYMDMGRYVTYEPLGINNWYVFSVLAQEEISSLYLRDPYHYYDHAPMLYPLRFLYFCHDLFYGS